MKRATHENLDRLRGHVDKEYGKLVQKLLAVALLEADAKRLVDRCTQGIDLAFELATERYNFEVKTSESDSVTLSAKDFEGMDRLVAEGNRVYIAVLTEGAFEDWVFSRYYPGEFPTGKKLTSFSFRPHRDRELEARIRPHFDSVIDQHTITAIQGRQSGMDAVLETYPERGRA
jgi:hypothetical protein